MTEKQKLFCDEYLIDLNGTRAYRTVYKTIKNDNVAGVRANKLLKQKDIAEYINKRLEEIHNENTANIQEVMEYLTSVMRGTSKANVLALAGDGYQEVIAKPPDEKERLKAAELLGKRFGMFKDNVDITSNGKTVIVDDIDED
ncbi:MAG: terminase small subunit [Faecalibacillus sp.]